MKKYIKPVSYTLSDVSKVEDPALLPAIAAAALGGAAVGAAGALAKAITDDFNFSTFSKGSIASLDPIV